MALLLRNDVPFVEASLAVSVLGAAPVLVNGHGRSDEVAFILEDSHALVLVAHADLLAPVRAAVLPAWPSRVVPTPPDIVATYGLDPATAVRGSSRPSHLTAGAAPRPRPRPRSRGRRRPPPPRP